MSDCSHENSKGHGKDRYGSQRYKCNDCGKTWTGKKPRPLGGMITDTERAKEALHLLAEGASIRAAERLTGLHRDTIMKLIVLFGTACRKFLDKQMQGLSLTHLQIDEQWTYVAKKQSRLTIDERVACHDLGDVYLWTCIDQQTKLVPTFIVGKRSADNARRLLMDIAGRIDRPNPHASDRHAYGIGQYRPVIQISTDGFAAYPEAVDLAFGPYAKFGVIIKEYRNVAMQYVPSEMVGTKRNAIKGDISQRSICTSHIERHNGTNRLFMKRLNRLTYCFSKKLENLEAAFAAWIAFYNFCWQTRRPGSAGAKRPTAAMMAKLTGHVWTFDELFNAVMAA
jgi:transposase-like protein/IS1 family transposase